MFTHLHVRSWFSFLRGASPPDQLVEQAAALGMRALAITDIKGMYGVVRHQLACKEHGLKPVFGAEVVVGGRPLVLLAKTRTGYANICRLLTQGFQRTETPESDVRVEELAAVGEDVICLTGGAEGLLWDAVHRKAYPKARNWVDHLRGIFGRNLYVELTNQLRPDDRRMVTRMARFASECRLQVVATGDVRYATPEGYALYDLMTCIRTHQTIFEGHPERPVNDQAFLRPEAELRRLIPHPEAFRNAERIEASCCVDLLPEYITPPGARLPAGVLPETHLRKLCDEGLKTRYAAGERKRARAQMERELKVICGLELEEFFLVVREVVDEAARRNIRCAGRGSAANSIVAYLLGITHVDPIAHRLLFERFLHQGRKGTPDIDIDFDSDRRLEIVEWIEDRFGVEQTAMSATLQTYQLRSALRDVAKALGYPEQVLRAFSTAVPHRPATRIDEYREQVISILGGETPLARALVEGVWALAGCPRHLGQHSGGMVLSRAHLHAFTPVQTSANGVKMVQFDKRDIERLGLVKLDVLGLRMLAALSFAEELIQRTHPEPFNLDKVPLDDRPTFDMIRAGETIGLFQIESQGQLHLLAMNQPETFQDLIAEIALFRPGPVQGGMVRPFVRRRKGQERVQFQDPSLEPILKDTYGIILFQEQVLEVAHKFAGMSLQEADDFRALMSKFRDPGQMESMRTVFVNGAMRRGVSEKVAQEVFEKVSKFVGYGFCRSHAAAFAKTVFQSAYLKKHFPAAYMAAVMQHMPGMYPVMTLEQEAKRLGVQVLSPDVNHSGILYDLEHRGYGVYAIRKPLTSIKAVSLESARTIFLERLKGPFKDVEDFYRRCAVDKDAMENIARSGALDELTHGSRKALWEVGVLHRRLGTAGRIDPQQHLFSMQALEAVDLPALAELGIDERLSWDYQTHGAARHHPMTVVRRQLNELEVRPVSVCYQYAQPALRGKAPVIQTAGIVILRQRPPTAKGFMFITLEDETGFIQCVVNPQAQDLYGHMLNSAALIVQGELQSEKNWRGIILQQAWRLDAVFGGYEGHASYSGGRDRHVVSTADAVNS